MLAPPALPGCLQEKAELKRRKEEAEAKYKWALIDGRREQVGRRRGGGSNVLAGLFRGPVATPAGGAHALGACHGMARCCARSCSVPTPRPILTPPPPPPPPLQVGNFRIEPPGLFRGRGEHPKMGKIKKRIYPRDVTINIGEGTPIPEHPYPGGWGAAARGGAPLLVWTQA